MSATITENPGFREVSDRSMEQHRITSQAKCASIPLPPFSKEGVTPQNERSFLSSSRQIESPKFEEFDRRASSVQVFGALLNKWELSRKEGALLLGYENENDVRDFLLGLKKLQTRDAKDRVQYLFKIHGTLLRLFEDAQVEKDWLREPNEYLDEKSPLNILMEGSMESLLLVKQFVERISGR